MKIMPGVILVVGISLVGLFIVTNHIMPASCRLSADELSALFTGLGFVGLVATLWHQRDEAMDKDIQHAELVSTMVAQTKEMAAQTQAMHTQRLQITRAAHILALEVSFRCASIDSKNQLMEDLHGKIQTALRQLEEGK